MRLLPLVGTFCLGLACGLWGHKTANPERGPKVDLKRERESLWRGRLRIRMTADQARNALHSITRVAMEHKKAKMKFLHLDSYFKDIAVRESFQQHCLNQNGYWFFADRSDFWNLCHDYLMLEDHLTLFFLAEEAYAKICPVNVTTWLE